jgi:AcrR family transcriptional regulator
MESLTKVGDCVKIQFMGPSSHQRSDAPAVERTDAQAAKIEAILVAATEQFSESGYAKTSMAAIATAAGVSRPALYQFFDNREDVFRSVLQRMLGQANDAALTGLEVDGSLTDKLDGFLQRRFGDLVELLAAMPHGAELIDAHLSIAPDIGQAADKALRAGVEEFLEQHYAAVAVAGAVDLLLLGPAGIKNDKPGMAVYRKRLTTLAAAVAALLERS